MKKLIQINIESQYSQHNHLIRLCSINKKLTAYVEHKCGLSLLTDMIIIYHKNYIKIV